MVVTAIRLKEERESYASLLILFNSVELILSRFEKAIHITLSKMWNGFIQNHIIGGDNLKREG